MELFFRYEDGIGIWFKRIDDRTKEFIRVFVRNYLWEVSHGRKKELSSF